MKIGFVPIDNRPVCYSLPKMICNIDRDIELFLPEREWLGSLTKYAETEELFEWLRGLPQLDALIISLDTLAYGGLISSRRCTDSFDDIKNRIEKLKQILAKKNAKIYAFSSIMRISNNNVNEEEKEYWSDWGKKIFNYSYNIDKFGLVCEKEVPDEILNDYLATRKRNFDINKLYLEWQKEGFFDTLIFSKDDCAEYGFNIREAKYLKNMGAKIKTGADEIPLSLLARTISGDVKIAPIFLEPDFKSAVSNYEDISIEKCTKSQIELANCETADEKDADILLYVNNFKTKQGEIVMGIDTEEFTGKWKTPEKPYMIADVRYANGSDNAFVNEFLKSDIKGDFYGYSAWNTSANSLGSLICAAKMKFLAKNFDENAFKRLQTLRFLDDWAYQANLRQSKLPASELDFEMKFFEKLIFDKLKYSASTSYKYPWARFFEVEIELN